MCRHQASTASWHYTTSVPSSFVGLELTVLNANDYNQSQIHENFDKKMWCTRNFRRKCGLGHFYGMETRGLNFCIDILHSTFWWNTAKMRESWTMSPNINCDWRSDHWKCAFAISQNLSMLLPMIIGICGDLGVLIWLPSQTSWRHRVSVSSVSSRMHRNTPMYRKSSGINRFVDNANPRLPVVSLHFVCSAPPH